VLALCHSAAMLGIDGFVVRVEADSAAGTPSLSLIGLPDRALGEARDRVRAAIVNSGYAFPAGRVLVSLAPADMRKVGPGFDLPIALALLALEEQVDTLALQRYIALGELALDGTVRATRGVLPMAIAAKRAGFDAVIVPSPNVAEAALVDGLRVYGIAALHDAVAIALGHGEQYAFGRARTERSTQPSAGGDFADVRGQGGEACARDRSGRWSQRAAGRTARLRQNDAGTTATVHPAHDVRCRGPRGHQDLQRRRATRRERRPRCNAPFSRPAPHDLTDRALRRGCDAAPRRDLTRSTWRAVLGRAPGFTRSALEVMRQPLEEGTITIARSAGSFVYPARFALVASMNPCPCGYRGTRTRECRCDDAHVARYVAKLSGPLLDRIDLHVEVARIDFDEIVARAPIESSATIRLRVEAARARQHERYREMPGVTNASLAGADVRRACVLSDDATALLRAASTSGYLSARAIDRIARVARTIADLANADTIGAAHVAEAIGYRTLERRGVAA